MAADDSPSHIFEPFFTTKEPGRGSGLGLAQVHGIVGAHEGHIDVESQMGQDTTFTIYLPLHPLELPTDTSLDELPALAKGQGEIILVVEDSVSTRKAIVESLELLNYRVLEATNGQEVLEVLEERGEEIALVLSDVVMPGMGGIALLHALREQGLAVQVVMLTGHPLENELEDLRAQGMIDWLPKPPGLEQLAEMGGPGTGYGLTARRPAHSHRNGRANGPGFTRSKNTAQEAAIMDVQTGLFSINLD